MSTENPSRPDDVDGEATAQIPPSSLPSGPEHEPALEAPDESLELPQTAPIFDGATREDASTADTVGTIGTFPLSRPAARKQVWAESSEDASSDLADAGTPADDSVPPETVQAAPAAAPSHVRRGEADDRDDVNSTAVRRRSLFATGEDPSTSSPASPASETEEAPTATVTPADAAPPATAALPADREARARRDEDPVWQPRVATSPQADRDEDEVLLDGSSVVGRPPSRAAAHWSAVLVAVVLFPCAWFLAHDGASYLTGGDATVWPTAVSARGVGEFAVGGLAFAVAVIMARRSSLGAFVVGLLCLLIGIPFVAAPAAVGDAIGSFLERLEAHSALGADLSHYLMTDGLSGRFVLLGLFMVALGVVSHSARRAGRREQEIVDRVRRG